jgi:hypothetical protein
MNERTILSCQAIESSHLLSKGIYIVISDALNAPPHIGMLFDGLYASLTHKRFEIGISLYAFEKKMSSIKSPCIFVQVLIHPVFSVHYLYELFVSILHQLKKADGENTTCLTPVKVFFQEGYQLQLESSNFVYQMIPQLQHLGVALTNYSILFNQERKSIHEYEFPVYERKDIQNRILNATQDDCR